MKVLVFFVLLISMAHAETHRITSDNGGSLIAYNEKFREWSSHGDDVVIDGVCASACTLVLAARMKLCSTDKGVLGFHSASRDGVYSRGATLFMWTAYRLRLQNLIQERGWDGSNEHPDPIYIPALQVVPRCR